MSESANIVRALRRPIGFEKPTTPRLWPILLLLTLAMVSGCKREEKHGRLVSDLMVDCRVVGYVECAECDSGATVTLLRDNISRKVLSVPTNEQFEVKWWYLAEKHELPKVVPYPFTLEAMAGDSTRTRELSVTPTLRDGGIYRFDIGRVRLEKLGSAAASGT